VIVKAHVVPPEQGFDQELQLLKKGDTFPLRLRPKDGNEFITVVNISATDLTRILIRIEGVTIYQGRHAKVVAQIFTDSKRNPGGYAELTLYP